MAKKNRVVSSRAKASGSTKYHRKVSRNKSIQITEVSRSLVQPQPENPNQVTSITPVTKPQTTEIISVPSLDVTLADKRCEMDGEELGIYIEGHVTGMHTTLRHLKPLIDEMKRKYSLLPRKKQVDGTYKTIRGCRSFKEWVETKLRKSEHTVYYLLAGGNPQNERAKLERKAAKQQLQTQPRNAPLTVTPTAQAAPLETVTKKAKGPFESVLNTIEKQEALSSDSARLAEAIEEITHAKSSFEALRDETQINVNDSPEGSPDTADQQECLRGFERIIDHLDSAASEADNVSNVLAAIE